MAQCMGLSRGLKLISPLHLMNKHLINMGSAACSACAVPKGILDTTWPPASPPRPCMKEEEEEEEGVTPLACGVGSSRLSQLHRTLPALGFSGV